MLKMKDAAKIVLFVMFLTFFTIAATTFFTPLDINAAIITAGVVFAATLASIFIFVPIFIWLMDL